MTDKPLREDRRFVSRITRDTLALVMAGGKGSRLHELTRWRAKPSIHFGGHFRLIDFPLSNCINSGIGRIGVLTQYKAHSLIRHLVQGWTWRLRMGREFLEILPASQRTGGEWYRGTADAVYQNLDIIRTHEPSFVLLLAGDHVYKMDYGPMIAAHVKTEADLTVSCVEVPLEEAAGSYGVMTVDAEGRVLAFTEKPERPDSIPGKPGLCLASMGNYVFNTRFLYEQVILDADNPRTQHDFGKDILPYAVARHRVFAYPFRDAESDSQVYWRDVGTLDAFWQANMELVSVSPELNLYDEIWPILTNQMMAPPAKFVFDDDDRRGVAIDSLVSAGSIVSGARVLHSLLSFNVTIEARSEVRESVINPEVAIGRNCRIRRAIVDRGSLVPDGTVIGEDAEADRARGFRVTDSGLVLVTPDMLGQRLHFTR
ncbi:MAG TPA: glucose-1-phosphate adenylyltransferase [Gammaproteobacteria bacterium]|nr:glucose-1-phosphate adenylyltransferase [Gammaproteobacteria bacterium]